MKDILVRLAHAAVQGQRRSQGLVADKARTGILVAGHGDSPLPVLADGVKGGFSRNTASGDIPVGGFVEPVARQDGVEGGYEAGAHMEMVVEGMAPVGIGVVQGEFLVADQFQDARPLLQVDQAQPPLLDRRLGVEARRVWA